MLEDAGARAAVPITAGVTPKAAGSDQLTSVSPLPRRGAGRGVGSAPACTSGWNGEDQIGTVRCAHPMDRPGHQELPRHDRARPCGYGGGREVRRQARGRSLTKPEISEGSRRSAANPWRPPEKSEGSAEVTQLVEQCV